VRTCGDWSARRRSLPDAMKAEECAGRKEPQRVIVLLAADEVAKFWESFRIFRELAISLTVCYRRG
jgi:hypothetical protein